MFKFRPLYKSDTSKPQTSHESSDIKSTTSQSNSKWRHRLHVGTKKGQPEHTQPQAPIPPTPGQISPRPKLNDSGLAKKYGKLGAVVGEGATGSIKLVNRDSDGAAFAVKIFRPRSAVEDEAAYIRKVKIEFNIGSCLHHGNIIETLDLFEVDKQWYEVMEYAPYCLFEIALSKKMSIEEIRCSFLQILAGVTYLHRLGYAHRDLKLENVVVTEKGIMKIIDFGSAMPCRHPVTGQVTLAIGIVGCLPYMAPEILLQSPYDPQKIDVWSLAIMYCCMILGRFPWKAPALYDETFRHFATTRIRNSHAERGKGRRLTEPSLLPASNLAAAAPCDLEACNTDTSSMIDINPDEVADMKATEIDLEPCRLLRQLPIESRTVIRKMLLLNADSRPTLEQIRSYPWIQLGLLLSPEGGGAMHYGFRHEHILRSG